MSDLLAARSQMAMSLAFHIVFAMVGIGMPLLMVLAEWRHLRTGEAVYLDLAKRWAKGTAILFAVGAVSGTVLSLELGLLWPGFMQFAGAIIGMPFSLEGFAFFTEAIFLGVYLYGRGRIPEKLHFLSGVAVAVSGLLSAFFVTCVNGLMNDPSGSRMENGRPVDIDPIAALAAQTQAAANASKKKATDLGATLRGVSTHRTFPRALNIWPTAFSRSASAISLP